MAVSYWLQKPRAISQESTAKVAAVAQLVERVLGKDEVMGSNPISSSEETVGGEGKRESNAAKKAVETLCPSGRAVVWFGYWLLVGC